MSAYRREFDKTECMSLLGKIIKFGKKSATLLKKNLTVKISKNKKNLIMKKSTQIFTIINYQKKALNVFAYQ